MWDLKHEGKIILILIFLLFGCLCYPNLKDESEGLRQCAAVNAWRHSSMFRFVPQS